MVNLKELFEEADRFEQNPTAALSLEALSGQAIKYLLLAMTSASSEDVKRKAAVDILNITKGAKSTTPAPTEAELEYLGRVIVEAEAVRLSGLGSEDRPRIAESLSEN